MTNTIFESNTIVDWICQLEIIFALIFLVFNAFITFINRPKTKSAKYLFAITTAISCLLISDVFVAKWMNHSGNTAYYIMLIFNMTYFLSNYTTIWLFVRYSLELVRQNGTTPKRILMNLNDGAYVSAAFLLLLNGFIPMIYKITNSNGYQRGDLFLITFLPVIAMFTSLIAIVIFYRSSLSGLEYTTILSYIVFPILAEILQILEPDFSWQPLAMAVLAIIIIMQNFTGTDRERIKMKNHQLLQEGKALQTRILILVCMVIVCFFGFIAKIAISFASNQMNKEIEAHYQMLANKTNEQASAWIVRETQILLNQKASLEIINNFDHDFLEEYFTYIVNDYNYDKYVYDLYFVNTKNEMASGTGYVQDPTIDFRERDWYEGALSSDNMCYTIPYVDVDTGRYVVTVSIKVFDRNRRFMGVLALDIFVEKLFTITEQQPLPDDSYLFITDNELGLVTHPNEGFSFVNESPQNMAQLSVEDYQKLVEYIKDDHSTQSYISFRDYDGIDRCFFVSKVDDCDWYIIAAISQDVIDESRNNMSRSVFVALIVCLILGITLTLWATNNIIRKLTEAQETARAASEAKSRFLANMSHEIRTPINAVLGMDEILLRECKDENLREYAQNIQSAGQSLLGVINDILDFSKIESDKLDLVPGKYTLGELVGSCINLIQIRVQEKALSFHTDRDQYLPKVLYGDEVRIRQIISNLLTNAVKYTKEGRITLYIGWNPISEEQGELVIRVKDTGIGIKKESLEDLFTSFQRLDEKKNRNIEGTGLGLSITKQLAELMGGKIEVESVYGEGSEFIVTLPQRIIDADNTASFQVGQESKDQTEDLSLHTKNARILVVDDVIMNLQVVKGLLKGTGLQIDTTERGIDAISLLQKNTYDIVFLDHMMPDLDGIETFRLIRKDYPSVYENTPIIMLTANAVLGVEEEYRNEGFAGYLSKPIDRDSLCRCILEHISKEKLMTAAEAAASENTKSKSANSTSDGKAATVSHSSAVENKIAVNNVVPQNGEAGDTTKNDEVVDETTNDKVIDETANNKVIGETANSKAVDETKNKEVAAETQSEKEMTDAVYNQTMLELDSSANISLQMLSKVIEGYNLNDALKYCNNDEEFLIEMLKEYEKTGFETRLQESFEAKDIKAYRTAAHSLKSTSLMIGFVDISERAKKLEMAAKDEDWNYIESNHSDVCERVITVLKTISQLIP